MLGFIVLDDMVLVQTLDSQNPLRVFLFGKVYVAVSTFPNLFNKLIFFDGLLSLHNFNHSY